MHISWFQHGYKVEIFFKNSWNCWFRQNFFTKTCLTNNYFSHDAHFVILAWVQSWNIFEKLMKLLIPTEFFTKTCLTNNYFSHDAHFVILAWVQSWNIFQKLMKLLIPTDFFHKNMSHEQLLFTWCTFRDSSIGTKLKYFWVGFRFFAYFGVFSVEYLVSKYSHPSMPLFTIICQFVFGCWIVGHLQWPVGRRIFGGAMGTKLPHQFRTLNQIFSGQWSFWCVSQINTSVQINEIAQGT